MKSYVVPILKGIIIGILEAKREKISFTITCSECGCIGELGDYLSNESGNIAVVNGDRSGENIVSIRCNKCGNEI